MEKHLILWADDDPDDMALFRRIVEQVDRHSLVVSAGDGREVLAYLDGMRKEKAFPCLVILDMNMPALGGRETIGLLKEDRDFAAIPLVMFTTSSLQADRRFCDHFEVPLFTKPSSLDALEATIRQLLGLCSCRRQDAPGHCGPAK
jgi:CheY-like chemotaxis protein